MLKIRIHTLEEKHLNVRSIKYVRKSIPVPRQQTAIFNIALVVLFLSETVETYDISLTVSLSSD